MKNLSFAAEPALWLGLANAILLVLVTFGVPISGEQKTAIDTLLGAGLAIITAIAIRSQVTPVSKAQPVEVITTEPVIAPGPPH